MDAHNIVIVRMMPYTVIARLGTSRGNLIHTVCHAEQREASPRNVILSATKDLKACTAVHRHGDLEILHYVQNDIVSVLNDIPSERLPRA